MLQFVSVGVACLAAASSSTLAGPGAPETFDESIPASIVSQEGLQHRVLGEALFGALPSEQQAMIASAGGIGPRDIPMSGLGVVSLDAPAPTAIELSSLIDAETLASLKPVHRSMLKHLTDLANRGEPLPALCLAPGTDPKTAEAFHVFMQGIAGGPQRYQYGTRWTRTARSGNGLIIGQPTTVTYSYVPDGTRIPNLNGNMRQSNLQAWLNGIYGAGVWEGLIDSVFARWGFLTGLTYIYEPNDNGADYAGTNADRGVVGVRGDVRIGATTLDGNSGVLAFNFFPDYGDMVLDSSDGFFNNTSKQHRAFTNVVSHEHGHGIGASHVCPTNGTKLMEPFINTNFLGPQLDDMLFGQRAYGDPLEDNDTLGTATVLGNMDPGNQASFTNISIDDNSDVDYFQFTTTVPVTINVSLTPAAAAYLNGVQNGNGSCSNGTTKNYQTIHDLAVEFLDGAGTVLGLVNNSGAGSVESASIDLLTPGTHYFKVLGSNANDIQLYDLNASTVLALAPLAISFNTTVGPEVAPNQPVTVSTTVVLGDDTFVTTPDLVYALDGGAQSTTAMASLGGGVYEAQIPAMACGSSTTFQVNVEGVFSGPVTLGPSTTFATLGTARSTVFSDNFQTDMGWTVSGSITSAFFGLWERLVPTTTTPNGPLTDADGSGNAYVTGNATFLSHVSGGDTILTSPVFDLSTSINPEITLSTWFDDDQGSIPSVNVFRLEISNDAGASWTALDTFGPNTADSIGGWIPRAYSIQSFVAPTATMMFRAIASDANGANIYEAGIDAFTIKRVNCNFNCAVDLNGDGVADNGDIAVFITLFLASDPAVDFNGDGFVDNGDIGQFIALFLIGC